MCITSFIRNCARSARQCKIKGGKSLFHKRQQCPYRNPNKSIDALLELVSKFGMVSKDKYMKAFLYISN